LRSSYRLQRAASGKFGFLLVAMIGLMLTSPLIATGWVWQRLIALFAGAVLVAGLQAARPGRRSLVLGLILALADFGIGRLVVVENTHWTLILQPILWLATMGFVTVTILEAVFEREVVDLETLQAAFCVYLLLGLLWAFGFVLIEITAPGSFHAESGASVAWFDDQSRRTEFVRLFILSYATLTGTNYGDVTPGSGFAYICTCLEALTGQVYLAVVIARLVGLHSTPTQPERA
jgi:hypothetical protein